VALTITRIGRQALAGWTLGLRQLRQDAQHADSKAAGHPPSPACSRAHQRGCRGDSGPLRGVNEGCGDRLALTDRTWRMK
jgi:hypothetical protein